jgi:hypothetical protein
VAAVHRLSIVVGALPYAAVCFVNIGVTTTHSKTVQYILSVAAFGLVGIGAAILWTGQGVSEEHHTNTHNTRAHIHAHAQTDSS